MNSTIILNPTPLDAAEVVIQTKFPRRGAATCKLLRICTRVIQGLARAHGLWLSISGEYLARSCILKRFEPSCPTQCVSSHLDYKVIEREPTIQLQEMSWLMYHIRPVHDVSYCYQYSIGTKSIDSNQSHRQLMTIDQLGQEDVVDPLYPTEVGTSSSLRNELDQRMSADVILEAKNRGNLSGVEEKPPEIKKGNLLGEKEAAGHRGSRERETTIPVIGGMLRDAPV
ncbi:hypothetical protein EV421DRAFT_927227 [Armillaria borealis]|uniref:Uncharacterized protein n=1 Tax=Armillaria borealis TaxID=47425 RepID=A0AA39JA03_9AGAR|nr:hypothetical protein EV421DRAFT_927227 [Armillaria borealis]